MNERVCFDTDNLSALSVAADRLVERLLARPDRSPLVIGDAPVDVSNVWFAMALRLEALGRHDLAGHCLDVAIHFESLTK